MEAPGPPRIFRVFHSAYCLGARSPGRFSGFSHQPVGRSGNSLWARCRIWVIRVGLAAYRRLPLYPRQRTSSGRLGRSVSCQKATSAGEWAKSTLPLRTDNPQNVPPCPFRAIGCQTGARQPSAGLFRQS